MNYFNNHRRKLIKQNYIRGTKATVQGSVPKLELEDTVALPPCKLEIEGNADQKQYEGAPQYIEAVSDFKLTVRGKNLFNEELLLSHKHITKVDNGYSLNEYFISFSRYDNPNHPLVNIFKSLKPNTDYTITYEVLSAWKNSSGRIVILDKDSIALAQTGVGVGRRIKTFNFTQEQIDNIYTIYIYGTAQTQVEITPTVMKSFQLLEGAYTIDTLPSYTPYIEPAVYDVSSVELAGIDNINDTLTVDYANGKAIKTERVLYKSVGELIDACGAEYDGIGAIYINNDQPRMEIYERNIPYYCTHFISYHDDPNMGEGNPRFEVTASGQIWFYYPPLRSVEEFKAWCYENDVKIAYVLENEHQIDMTNTEACQNLLNLTLPEGESVIFEVNSKLPPKSMTLEYYSKTKEDKHKITVNYEDISEMQIKDSDEHFVRRDSVCQITPPKIEGYEPESESITVYVENDMETTLIYNKK